MQERLVGREDQELVFGQVGFVKPVIDPAGQRVIDEYVDLEQRRKMHGDALKVTRLGGASHAMRV